MVGSVAVVSTTGLTMQFGSQRALDALDLSIEHGVTGLVGANGAGKTTLMSVLLGLRTPTDGVVRVLGLDPGMQGAELRSLVGYGPERNVFPDEMPASDFVKHFAEVRGMRSGSSVSARSGSAHSARCPPANVSASSSPRRWRPTRRWCSWTNPPTASTPCSATRCSC
jgi:ABC-2 type transport system ATP-binding protein